MTNTMTNAVGAAALVLGVALLFSGSLRADDTDDARAHFEQGIELFEEGKFEQAAISFQRAYELKPSYKLLYNIGQTENLIGNHTAALSAYSEYLTKGEDKIDAERRQEVEAEIAKLRGKVGRIAVVSHVDGAEIFVDGERRGEVPLTDIIYVDAGEHDLVIRDKGEVIYDERVEVAGGEQISVTAEGEAGGEDQSVEVPEPGGEKKRLWTWVALGVGGAAAVGAGITGGLAIKKTDDVKDNCDGNSCPPDQESDANSAKTMGTVATVLTAVAAAGIVAGAVLFFVEPGLHEKDDGGVTVAPSVSGDGAGIFVTGRF